MYEKYKRLERSILATKMDIRQWQNNIKHLLRDCGPAEVRAVAYDNVLVSSSRINKDANLKELYRDLARATGYLRILTEHLMELEKVKEGFDKEVEKLIKKNNTLELKVFFHHHIKKQPLLKVADNLGYAYGYVRNINSGIVQRIKQKDKNVTFSIKM